MTADGGPAGGGKKEAAGGKIGAREAAMRSEPPPNVRASSPDARRPPHGGRRKRSTRPACEHKRRDQAAHLAKPGVQPGAESGSGGLGGPVAFLSNRHDKPGATGADACTRDDGSGGPVTGRSGGTADHVAERNAGSGQAQSVTPLAARSVQDADGVERSG
jgi:hypothetical protein